MVFKELHIILLTNYDANSQSTEAVLIQGFIICRMLVNSNGLSSAFSFNKVAIIMLSLGVFLKSVMHRKVPNAKK